jgi:hypothetical protein
MIGKVPSWIKAELESLGWKCSESEADGRYTVMATFGEMSIVSSGTNAQLVWNAVYQDALRHSGKQGA